MPVILKFYGIVIRLICALTLGPRFSAIYGDSELIVDISSLRILCGEAPACVKAMVFEWARAHHQELADAWTRCRFSGQAFVIQPLT